MKRLAIILGALAVPVSVFASFKDVPSAYESRRAVEYLQSAGILQGYEDGTFRPTGTINRAELLKVLVAAKGIDPSPSLYMSCFPDVVDQWYAPYVCYAQQAGWVQGYPDGTFGPERPVAFVEALKMLTNVRGYPLAPAEESQRRGIDPSLWFAPYLTTSLLIDVVSFEQVWGGKAVPLQSPLRRGFVAQLLYRALLAEGLVRFPLNVAACTTLPAEIEIKTFVDVLMSSRTNVFRQELRGVDPGGASCLLASDTNPFGLVTTAFDPYFLQPYPGGQPANSWTSRAPLELGRAIVRGGAMDAGAFRPEVFVVDLAAGELRQLPSIFAGVGGSLQTEDGRYIVFIGSSGHTIEAVDLVAGTHAVIDAVQAPLTFLQSSDGGQDVVLSYIGTNIVTYSLYDSSAPSAEGYLLLETRTTDIDAALRPVPSFDPLNAPPSEPALAPAEDPFVGDMMTDEEWLRMMESYPTEQ